MDDAPGPPRPLVLRYPIVALTVVVGVLGAGAWVAGFGVAVQWGFAVFALVIAGIQAVRMIGELRRRRFGIDILAIIAIVATVAVGEVIASMIIVLMVSGGKALEDFAQGRAQQELTALLDREPRTAHRLDAGSIDAGSIDAVDIPAGDVVVGDRILVRSGEAVPVDGILTTATAAFDESSLTGESLPRTRVQGEQVLSGSVNGNTSATIRATARAEDSQYQAIVALVKQASSNRAPVVRLADRYAVPFTAVSLLLAGVAWWLSGDPVRFAEVLVLATPCPLVLAAPVALMGGMSRAARNGIIVKGGGVLELLAGVRTAVFDKTGTLTRGTPEIVHIDVLPPWDETTLLTLVASAEQSSSHVLAASIVESARARGLTPRRVLRSTEVAAQGVTATLDDHLVSVGTLQFAQTIAPGTVAAPLIGGEMAIYVVIDGCAAGTIIATDAVRQNASATIAGLRNAGVERILMLTGDAQATADHVAHEVGITEVQADCLPIDKVHALHSITSRPVLMIGDGVNDSPVLASADIGIAMGARGATAASEAASAVILLDDISVVLRAVQIGHDTVRIAMQSIWLGIALSLALMLIAAFGLIPATLGAGIQEIVDLATILNALRALRDRTQTAPPTTPAIEPKAPALLTQH
ncbi:cadmium-translocating P-type ATPase [Subtercola boreus]|uniref:Cadmium-translocating P-type ATPase n=1 Tax=Subtercola boreus TaxID=120213 RepID=A0A3E0VSG3_9MICO|nr:heavy metal translocating P-type ATPase [Subtercola boreus]RFA12964.1 cadmium-translocating P-type ATPase [Subtercola boreus]